MSGITGYFKPEGLSRNTKKNLELMLYSLKHRGDDGSYQYINEEQGIAIGHQYLHINGDPESVSPIFVDKQGIISTANGRFYDAKKQRTKLLFEGYELVSKNDNELVVPLYQKYGLQFVEHLRGEFAISLFDSQRKRLILARDRFGVKPLFYHITNGTIYWGSEIKALLAHPQITPQFEGKGLLHQLMHTMSSGSSAFQDIHAVKPGYMLIIDANENTLQISEKKYWDLEFPKQEDRDLSLSAQHHIDNTREQLLDAVAVRMEADQDVAAYLSGGIDSCAILGMASSLSQKSLSAFTISFDDDSYDESAIAREMAATVHAKHTQLILTADDLYGDNYAKTLWHAERTFYNTLGVAKKLMSRRVREAGCKIALTGEGSDELFGGYPSFKRDMLRYGLGTGVSAEESLSFQKLMNESNKLFTGAILSDEILSHPAMEDVCGFTPSWLQPWMKTLDIARPLLHDNLINELADYDPIQQIAASFDSTQLTGRHVLDKAQYTWCKTMLECQILNWGGDRVDMANAMESRPPFLDHFVAEMAVHIPPHLRINGNTEKWVLREAMKHIIPETLYKREKFAFMAPPGHTDPRKMQGLQSLLRKYMSEETVREAKIFDYDRLQQFMNNYKVDTDPVSLTRKDALINHILGLHILWHHFIA
ncbi:asparagine synthase (glutamine-hydrolyzing) [Sphingobacterium sp. UT-1RO-CII-1]|uniref:asparagine synthase (glutamine-hydrolyzing) n=1 Tax=Sphingobacterium sp. UT-1RO-CII-1 TaxID=2995225 RepID=UPI00227A3F5A|nr:asparagine synthase (glutamine-hydrolyzing) [Sphingobacterium sp. UT-1RO-CII-1]MCY4779402.1 asparagine synthase (glutamine-hydrolyzing) [Sphingobacterium sp. UT-1RO-CII-1]